MPESLGVREGVRRGERGGAGGRTAYQSRKVKVQIRSGKSSETKFHGIFNITVKIKLFDRIVALQTN